ncbi:cyclin-I [Festucalex cinctus]
MDFFDSCDLPLTSEGAPLAMKGPDVGAAAEERHLLGLLEATLARETRLWKAPVFRGGCGGQVRLAVGGPAGGRGDETLAPAWCPSPQGADVSPRQHQDAIVWLHQLNGRFGFCPETFALAVCVLNRIVSVAKVRSKYLKCTAFTSLVLAAKINAEDEAAGRLGRLVTRSGCSFSTAEIVRMERVIVDKLHWDLYAATPLDFVHIVRVARFPFD